MTPYMAISVCFRHIWGEIGPPPIMMIYISSGSDFHKDSKSKVRNSKFHPWHLIWPVSVFLAHISEWNLTSTNHDDIYIIWIRCSQRFWIWFQKFKISPLSKSIDLTYLCLTYCCRFKPWLCYIYRSHCCNTNVCNYSSWINGFYL